MRKIIVSEFYTLDGVFEEPGEWPKGYWNDEIEKYKRDELFSGDALLLGRVTYDLFASSWPNMKDAGEFAVRMNNMPKYVVSKTLDKPTWTNTTVIKDNVVEEIKKLKEQPGGDIFIYGSGELIHSLLPHHVIDEIRFLLYPFTLGKGQHLFREDGITKFKLIETQKFSTGVVALHYETIDKDK